MSKNIFVINIHPSFSRKRIPLPTEVGRFLLAVLIEQDKKLEKKFASSGLALFMMHKRTSTTACHVCRRISGVDFSKLTMSLYAMCNEEGFKEFTRPYEAALEYAYVQPEKFVNQLYGFYTKQAKTILSSKSLGKFISFLTFMYCREKPEDEAERNILRAYTDLLFQQTEFLRPGQ